MELDCQKGTLGGDIYAGNHGWAYYKGAITDSTVQITITSNSGFPPYDTTYRVVQGVKL